MQTNQPDSTAITITLSLQPDELICLYEAIAFATECMVYQKDTGTINFPTETFSNHTRSLHDLRYVLFGSLHEILSDMPLPFTSEVA